MKITEYEKRKLIKKNLILPKGKNILGMGRGYTVKKLSDGTERYVAQICINGKNKYIGRFDTPVEAISAYRKKLKEINPEFDLSLLQ